MSQQRTAPNSGSEQNIAGDARSADENGKREFMYIGYFTLLQILFGLIVRIMQVSKILPGVIPPALGLLPVLIAVIALWRYPGVDKIHRLVCWLVTPLRDAFTKYKASSSRIKNRIAVFAMSVSGIVLLSLWYNYATNADWKLNRELMNTYSSNHYMAYNIAPQWVTIYFAPEGDGEIAGLRYPRKSQKLRAAILADSAALISGPPLRGVQAALPEGISRESVVRTSIMQHGILGVTGRGVLEVFVLPLTILLPLGLIMLSRGLSNAAENVTATAMVLLVACSASFALYELTATISAWVGS